MKIVFISDTHGFQDKVSLPEGDILVHAGDITMSGYLNELRNAADWFNKQAEKFSVIIAIAGNHDFCFEDNRKKEAREILALSGVKYLENDGCTVNGVRFYGSPVTPWFGGWAFNEERGDKIKKYWDRIPETDVLITHGPPKGRGDLTPPRYGADHVGCDELSIAVSRVNPKIHVFGHIHNGYGIEDGVNTKFVNASICNEEYRPINQPITLEI